MVNRELLVQALVNRGNADAGDSGANIDASAVISVMITMAGIPVDDLGTTTGNGLAGVVLPAGWTLSDGFNVRPYGCGVTVTEFTNAGSGIYDIRIVPFVNTPTCAWMSGEYLYAVQIKLTRTIGGKKARLQGGTLAKLTIP